LALSPAGASAGMQGEVDPSWSEPSGGLEITRHADGASEVLVARDGMLLGAILVADAVRPEARGAVQAVHGLGIRTLLLTGDNRTVAEAVGEQLGNDLLKFSETLAIARWTRRIIWQNFVGTIAVDLVGMGLAAVGVLNPLLAAFIHVASELTFILNSARLLPAAERAVHQPGASHPRTAGCAPPPPHTTRASYRSTESFGDQVAYVHLDGEGTLVRAAPEVDAELFDARARTAIAAAQQGT
jgi:hypothetical protein